MFSLLPFLLANRRPLAWLAGALLLATVLAWAIPAGQRLRLQADTRAAQQQQAGHAAAGAAAAARYDSMTNRQTGRLDELRRQQTQAQDELRRRYPARLVLPADPVRQ